MTEKELRNKVVATAKKYLGCKESDGSHKKIIDRYNSHKPLARGYKVQYDDPWCATYASAIGIECGLTDIMPTECSCSRLIELYKKLGSWKETDSYKPEAGDLIMYDWEDSGKGENTGAPNHVGIVVSVSGNTIKVIEGNKNNAVEYRDIAVNGKFIRGYCLPNYASKATVEQKPVVKPAPAPATIKVGSSVKVKQGAKNYAGKKLASFVYTRVHKVKQINGNRVVITYNGIVVAAMHKDSLYLV